MQGCQLAEKPLVVYYSVLWCDLRKGSTHFLDRGNFNNFFKKKTYGVGISKILDPTGLILYSYSREPSFKLGPIFDSSNLSDSDNSP